MLILVIKSYRCLSKLLVSVRLGSREYAFSIQYDGVMLGVTRFRNLCKTSDLAFPAVILRTHLSTLLSVAKSCCLAPS